MSTMYSMRPDRHKKPRYSKVEEKKFTGATYTPSLLADFVSEKILETVNKMPRQETIKILDPASGDGALLHSLIGKLIALGFKVEAYGFDTSKSALEVAQLRLEDSFPDTSIKLFQTDFLAYVASQNAGNTKCDITKKCPDLFDFVIANPPYVRTQILGAEQVEFISKEFSLSGRVDLYYAFIIAISTILKPSGLGGVITSNRFMTTKSGTCVRKSIIEKFNLKHLWDMGDTKLFEAAVLPAVLLLEGKNGHVIEAPLCSSIYEFAGEASDTADNPMDALTKEGIIEISDGRKFEVQHGLLNTGDRPGAIWTIATKNSDAFLQRTSENTWNTFRKIGKIKVGVKTTADKVFIRNNWEECTNGNTPELLKPLTTHRVARRYKSEIEQQPTRILYTHKDMNKKRTAIDISKYPNSLQYLERFRTVLQGRKYVIDAGRKWYEIWVPQQPKEWSKPKLVFRDISEKPVFWIDLDGTIVNGDCYWLSCDPSQEDLLWLAVAVANSTFIELFYDHKFKNKLYAGRRRFITQYVEHFPLPDPMLPNSKNIISLTKQAYDQIENNDLTQIERDLNILVWNAFGFGFEEISW